MINTVEFFQDVSGLLKPEILYRQAGYSLYEKFYEMDELCLDELWQNLAQHQDAYHGLLHLRKRFSSCRREILAQFIMCNWRVLDRVPDIDGQKLNFENVPCPHKGQGTCPFGGEGVVCIK